MSSYVPYPYPVLGNDTEINGDFAPRLFYSLSPENVILKNEFELNNDYYGSLIKSGDAEFVVDVSCNRTFFRKVYRTNELSCEIMIPASALRGKVDVVFYICAKKSINYNPITGEDDAYLVSAGDVIGYGGSAAFSADKEFDPQNAPVKSFIKIMCYDGLKDYFDISYDEEDYVAIRVPKDMYDTYTRIKNNSSEILHSGLVFPALIDIVSRAREDEFSNKNWAQKLNEIYVSRSINPDDDPVVIAQELLDNPVSRVMSWCDDFEEDD